MTFTLKAGRYRVREPNLEFSLAPYPSDLSLASS